MQLTVQEILEATKGNLRRGNPAAVVSTISTDSRTLQKGDLFVCLSGPNFDGHAFIDEVISRGALGVVLKKDRWDEKWKSAEAVFIGVEDPLFALGEMARAWRRRFTIPLVAITGSNGKTTTKDMTAAILGEKFGVLATEGNLNNLIGVPRMLFKLEDRHEAAVIEMGMNDFGEVARLAQIAEPTVGLITNVAYAHVEKLKSLEGVARAKGELFEVLPKGAVALVNHDDPLISRLPTRAYKISFGMENPADVFCTESRLTPQGIEFTIRYLGKTYPFQCPVIGQANVRNAVASVAAGFALGVEVKAMQKALKKFKGRPMRMERITLKDGMELLNDCYNANPSSTQAALETLAGLKGERPGLAVLGEMLEMGDFAAEGHRIVGRAVARHRIGYLAALGPHAGDLVAGAKEGGLSPDRCLAALRLEEIEAPLLEMARLGKVVLIKGSRGARMERVTEFLQNRLGEK
jgi:UDP-N-acetylmuramoyl-tripeptide--D-alanyl-D-alanine ligase